MALSDMQCRTSKPKAKKYKLFDGEGLYLEIMPTGARYWRLKYRRDGTEKRFAIGVYPAVTLQAARIERSRLKEEIKAGIDPVLAKQERVLLASIQAVQTLEAVAREWHGKNAPAWDEGYAQTVLHRLEKYAFPDLGFFPLPMIKPMMVLHCLQKIEETAPEMARRILCLERRPLGHRFR
ncbi:DUF4102 domain-containing protein [Chitinophaga oryziterrae]|uniref:DUF4102 domain-containing protein n=1 Tax=Chitinophaga oryziterrae TaxID=1031224 RepID=A0A6N8JAY1_9BACT|nr:integrase arm-type DNA-binding domain-containing protein [Chitinophaga oryziterrae]MVT42407.1 DUF4102 domain-containing protein [Chitinophaga oryziterrae]